MDEKKWAKRFARTRRNDWRDEKNENRDATTTTGERESGKGASKSRGNDEKMGEGGEGHDVGLVVVVG